VAELNEDERERAYLDGSRQAWLLMLGECIRHLRDSTEPLEAAQLLSERTEAVAVLRRGCEEFGDNDWDDNLHLADVIDKHLLRYLPAK
jgi:hypothetical protein